MSLKKGIVFFFTQMLMKKLIYIVTIVLFFISCKTSVITSSYIKNNIKPIDTVIVNIIFVDSVLNYQGTIDTLNKYIDYIYFELGDVYIDSTDVKIVDKFNDNYLKIEKLDWMYYDKHKISLFYLPRGEYRHDEEGGELIDFGFTDVPLHSRYLYRYNSVFVTHDSYSANIVVHEFGHFFGLHIDGTHSKEKGNFMSLSFNLTHFTKKQQLKMHYTLVHFKDYLIK